jgi:hypothetical protein
MDGKQKIKALYVNNGDCYKTGNKNGSITEIINHSQEYEDHTDYVYEVKSNGKTFVMVINCPVTVEYEVG